MMTETFKNTETPIISVIGIGGDSRKYIDEIKGWNSPLVSSKMLDCDFTGPGGGIEMAIMIITENVDATILAKNLKQSGLLTIIVATCEIRAMEGSYDSIALVPENRVMETVKTLTEFLSKPKIICLDFNDLCYVLKDSRTFRAFIHTSLLQNGSITNAVNYLKKKLKGLPSLETMLVNITLSQENKDLLKTENRAILEKACVPLSNSFSVLFGLNMTDNLGKDELAIYVIAAETRKS